jgi:hypothetical protein
LLNPDTVLFGRHLPTESFARSAQDISLVVSPANSLEYQVPKPVSLTTVPTFTFLIQDEICSCKGTVILFFLALIHELGWVQDIEHIIDDLAALVASWSTSKKGIT